MKQLYPVTICSSLTHYRLFFTTVIRLFIIILLLIFSSASFSQSNLNFHSRTVESGTANTQGCVYRFSAVTANGHIDALVSIDSLIGVTIPNIDSTPSGTDAAFQPTLSSTGGKGYHYAVFTITFVGTGTTNPVPLNNFSTVFHSIDGSNQITEFNSITVADASWQYLSNNPTVAVTQDGNLITGTATSSSPSGGQAINLTDSAAMFKVSANSAVTSFTVRFGWHQSSNGWNGNVLFSMNATGPEVQPAILPANILSFTAKQENDKISLIWSTGKEENVSHYIIERSYNSETYNQAALVFAAEISKAVNNYSYQDPINKNATVIYYRLKMVDKDGAYKYSAIKPVTIGSTTNETAKLTTYPNPVRNDLRIVLPESWQNKTIAFQLINTAGIVIKSYTIQKTGVTTTISMREIPAGMYFLKAIKGKDMYTETIVKPN